MSSQILHNIKGSEIPASWRKQIDTDPGQFYTIVIKLQNEILDEESIFPEEKLSPEIVKTVEQSSMEYRMGQGTLCCTKEERVSFYKEVWENE